MFALLQTLNPHLIPVPLLFFNCYDIVFVLFDPNPVLTLQGLDFFPHRK